MPNHTLLLLHGDSLVDSGPFNIPLKNFGVQVSTAQSKFGGKSLYFNGGSHLEYPSKITGLCTDNWTIDWWEYSQSGTKPRYSSLTAASGKLGLVIVGSGTLWCSTDGSYWAIQGLAFIDAVNNVWTHRAIVKSGGLITTYKNGKKVASSAISGNVYCTDGFSTIGCNREISNFYAGYIDEFRISDVARWTYDFTPPTKPYPNPVRIYENSTLIDGVAYKITKGNCLVSGTNREILSGIALVEGVVMKITLTQPEKVLYFETKSDQSNIETLTLNGKNVRSPGKYNVKSGDKIYLKSADGFTKILLNGNVVVKPTLGASYTYTVSNKNVTLTFVDAAVPEFHFIES